MVAETGQSLVGEDLQRGIVERGFAETVLQRALATEDPFALWVTANELAAAAQFWNGLGDEKTEIKSAQMFCEVRLGHVLGPNPGAGGDQVSAAARANPHADSLIPAQRVAELRRFHQYLGALIEEIRNGARSRRKLLTKVEQWEAGERPPSSVGDLDIRSGDFRTVLADIEPGSVALVLTDPPYPAEYLPLWDDLGAWSAEHLADGGSLVAYSGQAHLPEVFDRLRPHLRYWWTIAQRHDGRSQRIPGKWVMATWKPVVWFVRGHRATQSMLADSLSSASPRKTIPTGDDGSWAQAVEPLAPIIWTLTAPGDLIVDPFAGSGTVGLAALQYGRRFIGAEIRA